MNFKIKFIIKQENIDDTLEKGSESVANFVLPGLNNENNDIIGLHGINGMKKLKNQLENNKDTLLNLINKKFFNNKIKDIYQILRYDEVDNNFKGLIYNLNVLKIFSSKFYTAITNLNKLEYTKQVCGPKLPETNLFKLVIAV